VRGRFVVCNVDDCFASIDALCGDNESPRGVLTVAAGDSNTACFADEARCFRRGSSSLTFVTCGVDETGSETWDFLAVEARAFRCGASPSFPALEELLRGFLAVVANSEVGFSTREAISERLTFSVSFASGFGETPLNPGENTGPLEERRLRVGGTPHIPNFSDGSGDRIRASSGPLLLCRLRADCADGGVCPGGVPGNGNPSEEASLLSRRRFNKIALVPFSPSPAELQRPLSSASFMRLNS